MDNEDSAVDDHAHRQLGEGDVELLVDVAVILGDALLLESIHGMHGALLVVACPPQNTTRDDRPNQKRNDTWMGADARWGNLKRARVEAAATCVLGRRAGDRVGRSWRCGAYRG